MNKISKFFLAVAAISMTACSSDEPINNTNPVNPDEAEYGDNYLSISISMPTGAGGRASTATGDYDNDEYDNFDDGTEAESKVNNIVFFFFDGNNNCIDIQKLDAPTFNKETQNDNPYVTSIGVKEVRLKSGLPYEQVAVALNSNESVASLRNAVKDLKTLQERSKDYASQYPAKDYQINADGSNQLMSNSVYFETGGLMKKPTEADRVILVKIDKDKNIYDSTERETLGKENGKEYVDIYVERVAARIDVSIKENITDNFYVGKDDEGNDITTLKLFNNTTFTSEDVYVIPVIEGMMLDVLTPSSKLIKPLHLDEVVGYTDGATNYQAFKWNDPINKRSYWASTSDFLKNDMGYYSWDQMAAKGTKKFSQYINPNTQDFLPDANNENLSKNTKVVVAATLKYYRAGQTKEDAQPLDLVRYGSEHMFADNLLAQTASLTNAAIRAIDWNTVQDDNQTDPITFTAAEKVILATVVNNSFLGIGANEAGLKSDKFTIVQDETEVEGRESGVPYEAKVKTDDDFKYEVLFDATLFNDYKDADLQKLVTAYNVANSPEWADLIERASVFIDKAIEAALENVNQYRILYWKGGKTYYYYVIRHQGFHGLTGSSNDNYLFGVVRNHIYDVQLNALYGLGTPVIESGDPIDPERPTEERPNYISARINILPWRVVTNNATIH